MGKRLNIEPQFLPATVGNLLNGAFASLSGPIGFTPTQPRIVVKEIRIISTDDGGFSFSIYKGASGGSSAGTLQLTGGLGSLEMLVFPVDIVLDAGDFLTGIASTSSKVVVSIAAEIEF